MQFKLWLESIESLDDTYQKSTLDLEHNGFMLHSQPLSNSENNIIIEEKDACYHKVKARYRVFPSAYASGALVKCRKVGADNWGNSGKKKKKQNGVGKNENIERSFCNEPENMIEMWDEKIPVCDKCSAEILEGTFDLEKEKGLHGWFSRNKGKGWIDCKKSKKGNLVPCGRSKGVKREYPACRPTLSACNKKGTRRKKNSKPISWK